MVSEMRAAEKKALGRDLFVPEFGVITGHFVDTQRNYQGRVYKLNAEAIKPIADAIGFAARFELPAVRTAYADVFKTEGHIVFEIERNTKPMDVSVRYMRDRWNVLDLVGKGSEGLRPWIKTEYQARYLPEDVIVALAEQVKVRPEVLQNFVIRVNFKDRIVGLIGEEKNVDQFPSGAYAWFSLPGDGVAASSLNELADGESVPAPEKSNAAAPAPASHNFSATKAPVVSEQREVAPQPVRTTRGASSEPAGQAKYATYSRSEIDLMFKQQADSILNALSGKVAAQQRAFQESVANQEKSFNKICDSFTSQFEAARAKLEGTAKSSQEKTKQELDEFHKQLSKELDQYRSQINKSILPVAKALEDKAIKQPSKEQQQVPKQNALLKEIQAANSGLQKLVLATLVVSLLSLVVSFVSISANNATKQAATGSK